MNSRFAKHVALVTGGASGVGLEVVRLLHAQGARVAISDINVDAGMRLVAELGERAHFIHHDVSSEESWQTVISDVLKTFGELNVLVNNAGILLAGDIENGKVADLRKLLQVNTESVFIGCQQGILAMKEHGGSIINIASLASWMPMDKFRPTVPARLPWLP